MLQYMLKSKIHRATVIEADLNYEGSLTVDRNLSLGDRPSRLRRIPCMPATALAGAADSSPRSR